MVVTVVLAVGVLLEGAVEVVVEGEEGVEVEVAEAAVGEEGVEDVVVVAMAVEEEVVSAESILLKAYFDWFSK